MPLLGTVALWVALLTGVWGVAMGVAAARAPRPDLAESARRAGVASALALVIAVAALALALLRQDWNVAYVASYSDRAIPLVYRFAALYAGPEGQLLLWTAGLALCSVAPRSDHPAAIAATAAVITGAVSLLLLARNPFVHLPYTPVDGRGLAPDLQDVGMLIYPPMLFVGTAAAVVPAARAAAARFSRMPVAGARGLLLVAWLALTLGIAAGWWWAYRRLGWEGSWPWDPVRHQVLPAWLAVTVALHVTRLDGARRSPLVHAAVLIGAGALSIWGMFVPSSFEVALTVTLVTVCALVGVVAATWPVRTHPPRRGRWAARIACGGALLVVVVLASQAFRVRAEQTLSPGESATLRAWGGRTYTFSYLAASRYPVTNRIVTRAVVEVRRGSVVLGRLDPEQRQHVDVFGNDNFGPVSRAATLHRGSEDVLAVLVSVSDEDDRAVLRLAINPLILWAWIGMMLMAGGGFVVFARDPLP